VKYAFIAQQNKSKFPVRLMCQWLEVSPAGYYASLDRAPSKRARANARLKLEIRAVHSANRRRYGALKIHRELKDQGISCGHNRVARLMREDGLRSKRPKQFRVTTQSGHREPVAANLLERKFSVSSQCEPDRVWVADITYLPTLEGWLYLSVLLDLSSRRVIGWHAHCQLDHELALEALMMALSTRRPRNGKLLHHSDRGVQYACDRYQHALASRGIEASMSRKGDCWDNAVAESFFASLKTELVSDAKWQTRSEAMREVAEYIDWYNNKRRHQTLGYLPPARYEIEWLKKVIAA
jgi:putative transposase